MSASPIAAGAATHSLTSLWAWDSAQARWYFYAPSLQAQGLADHISTNGFLDFTAANKTLGPGVGFWLKVQ
jgi:hypothetical protein